MHEIQIHSLHFTPTPSRSSFGSGLWNVFIECREMKAKAVLSFTPALEEAGSTWGVGFADNA